MNPLHTESHGCSLYMDSYLQSPKTQEPSLPGRLLSLVELPARMPLTTLTPERKRGRPARRHPETGSDINARVLDLRAAGWSYTQIATATGYTRRHVIRICLA